MIKNLIQRPFFTRINSSSICYTSFNYNRCSQFTNRKSSLNLLRTNDYQINYSTLNQATQNNTTKEVSKPLVKTSNEALLKRKFKKKSSSHESEKSHLKVIALPTAESYDLDKIKEIVVNEGVYEVVESVANEAERDFLCLKAKYKSSLENDDETRIIFLFSEGKYALIFRPWFSSIS